jgi:hypothetical protein
MPQAREHVECNLEHHDFQERNTRPLTRPKPLLRGEFSRTRTPGQKPANSGSFSSIWAVRCRSLPNGHAWWARAESCLCGHVSGVIGVRQSWKSILSSVALRTSSARSPRRGVRGFPLRKRGEGPRRTRHTQDSDGYSDLQDSDGRNRAYHPTIHSTRYFDNVARDLAVGTSATARSKVAIIKGLLRVNQYETGQSAPPLPSGQD